MAPIPGDSSKHQFGTQMGLPRNLGVQINKIRNFLHWDVSWKSLKRQPRDIWRKKPLANDAPTRLESRWGSYLGFARCWRFMPKLTVASPKHFLTIAVADRDVRPGQRGWRAKY